MRLFSMFLATTFSMCALSAQNGPLVADAGRDQFDFCKQLYRQANATPDPGARWEAYRRVIPRLEIYLERFPNHANAAAATYYLGESYYHSGSMDEGKRMFHRVVNRFRKGRYVALASNRLGYDAVANKKYAEAAVYFGRVATMSTTEAERNSGRYKEASCYSLAGQSDQAIRAYSLVEAAKEAPVNYRENAKLRLGHLYLAKKDLIKAAEKFEGLMLPEVGENTRIDATFQYGLISLEQKDVETAERCFKAVILSKGEKFKGRAQAALMNIMFVAKNYQGVIDVIKRGNHPGTPATEAIKYVIAGKSAYQLKFYHEAIKFFAQAERQVPLSEHAFEAGYFRLLCFFSIEGSNIPMQVDAFLEVYQQGYAKHERIHKALLMKAETLYDNTNYREASAAYNQINADIVGDSNKASLLYKHGWSLSLSGDHNGAVRSLTNFLNQYPDDSRALHAIARRGKSYLALGDRVSALKDFDLLIKRFPEDKLAALAWQHSARIKKEDQDYADMIRRYEAMFKAFPNLRKSTVANARYWMGWGNFQLKKYAEAIPFLEQAAKLEPNNYAAKAGLLTVYSTYEMKDKARLQAAVDEMGRLGKEDAVAGPIYRWLGMQCFNADEMKACERYLTLGTNANEPRQTPNAFWKTLGKARVETGKYKEANEAIKNFLDVVEEPFWKAEALLDQAQAYLGLEKLDEAKKSAEEGLSLRPKGQINAELRTILGDIAYNNKDYAAAAANYVVVAQLFVNDSKLRPDALYKSYMALNKKGDNKEANHYLKTLNKEFPDYLKKK